MRVSIPHIDISNLVFPTIIPQILNKMAEIGAIRGLCKGLRIEYLWH
tara:strand:+ start:63 stop:203 length:141 start_codon:yes stop_codon:yes gene_type:complete